MKSQRLSETAFKRWRCYLNVALVFIVLQCRREVTRNIPQDCKLQDCFMQSKNFHWNHLVDWIKRLLRLQSLYKSCKTSFIDLCVGPPMEIMQTHPSFSSADGHTTPSSMRFGIPPSGSSVTFISQLSSTACFFSAAELGASSNIRILPYQSTISLDLDFVDVLPRRPHA